MGDGLTGDGADRAVVELGRAGERGGEVVVRGAGGGGG